MGAAEDSDETVEISSPGSVDAMLISVGTCARVGAGAVNSVGGSMMASSMGGQSFSYTYVRVLVLAVPHESNNESDYRFQCQDLKR